MREPSGTSEGAGDQLSGRGTQRAEVKTDAAVAPAEVFSDMPASLVIPDALESIRSRNASAGETLVVLDDDPTGSQTLSDVPLVMQWDVETLSWGFEQSKRVFFVLTNSRSMSEEQAAAINHEVMANLFTAAKGRPFRLLSRGDSTLRGHFAAETGVLADELQARTDRTPRSTIFCPAFPEAGRVTAGDVHWVEADGLLQPVGLSEYARDERFAYRNSRLTDWVIEVSGPRRPVSVVSVGLRDIREGGPARVTGMLRSVAPGSVVIVNAVEDADLEVFVLGLLDAEAAGAGFVYRSGPSFARVRAGIAKRGGLDAAELRRRFSRRGPGLLVVGSHVTLTNVQVGRIGEDGGFAHFEMNVDRVLDAATRAEETGMLAAQAAEALGSGTDVLIQTSRKVRDGADESRRQVIGRTVSHSLSSVVRHVVSEAPPAWVISKGGVTSSDVAVQGLGMQRAWMLGQVLGGTASVWSATLEDRQNSGMPYAVFPGNVGTADSLAEAVRRMREFSRNP